MRNRNKNRITSLALALAIAFTMSTTSLSACETEDEITIQDSMAEGYDGIAELPGGMYGNEITTKKGEQININDKYVYIDFDSEEDERYYIETPSGQKGYISYDRINKAWKFSNLSKLFPNGQINEVLENEGLNIRDFSGKIIGKLGLDEYAYALEDSFGRTIIIVNGEKGSLSKTGTVSTKLSTTSPALLEINNPTTSSLIQGVEGIDISQFNAFSKEELTSLLTEKQDYLKYVYIRLGYSGFEQGEFHEDTYAREYIEVCESLGIPYGLYFVSKATTREEGIAEAEKIIEFIKSLEQSGHNLLPIALDLETDDSNDRLNGKSDSVTEALMALIDTLRNNGIKDFTIYTNLKGLGKSDNIFSGPLFSTKTLEENGYIPKYGYWIAAYQESDRAKVSELPIFMFQYSDEGTIFPTKPVDMNNTSKEIFYLVLLNKQGEIVKKSQ